MRRLIGEMVDAKRRTSDEKWMPRVKTTMRNAKRNSYLKLPEVVERQWGRRQFVRLGCLRSLLSLQKDS